MVYNPTQVLKLVFSYVSVAMLLLSSSVFFFLQGQEISRNLKCSEISFIQVSIAMIRWHAELIIWVMQAIYF